MDRVFVCLGCATGSVYKEVHTGQNIYLCCVTGSVYKEVHTGQNVCLYCVTGSVCKEVPADRRKHHHSPVRAMEWSQPAPSIL